MSRLDPIKEAQAVTALKETLAALALGAGIEGLTEDTQLLLDSVEGETDFYEAVDRILERIADDNAMVAAVKEQEGNLKARRERFAKRAETNKALIEQAFLIADLPKVERPLGTLYLSNRAPKVVIETESEIPTQYWKPADPTLDQKLLGDDLKAKRDGLEAIIALPPGARGETVQAFHQRFLDSAGHALLQDRLGALDAIPPADEEARNAALALLRRDFASLPGATLSAGSRSLSIRAA